MGTQAQPTEKIDMTEAASLAWKQVEGEEGETRIGEGRENHGNIEGVPTGDFVGTGDQEVNRLNRVHANASQSQESNKIGVAPEFAEGASKEKVNRPLLKEPPLHERSETIYEPPTPGVEQRVRGEGDLAKEMSEMADSGADAPKEEAPIVEQDPGNAKFLEDLKAVQKPADEDSEARTEDLQASLEARIATVDEAAKIMRANPAAALKAMGIDPATVNNGQSVDLPKIEIPEDADPAMKTVLQGMNKLQEQNYVLAKALDRMQSDSAVRQQNESRASQQASIDSTLKGIRSHLDKYVKTTPMLRERGPDIVEIAMSKIAAEIGKVPAGAINRNRFGKQVFLKEVSTRLSTQSNADSVKRVVEQRKQPKPMTTSAGTTVRASGKERQRPQGPAQSNRRYDPEEVMRDGALEWLATNDFNNET
jgi:hypothetical protein